MYDLTTKEGRVARMRAEIVRREDRVYEMLSDIENAVEGGDYSQARESASALTAALADLNQLANELADAE